MGYRIWYAQLRYAAFGIDESYQHVEVTYPRTEVSLDTLVGQLVYEVKVTAFNGFGDGPTTPPYDIYVGEAGKDTVQCDFCWLLFFVHCSFQLLFISFREPLPHCFSGRI